MTFPSDIKGAMRDCILKLLWPKKDIVAFFADNGCTTSDVEVLGDQNVPRRHELIDTMFAHLSAKPDGGLGPYRAMLQSLTTWSHFDPYYFDNLAKLNRADADRAIDHLKQLQEIRDQRLKKERVSREGKEAAAQDAKKTLAEIRARFIELLQGAVKPQKRGYELETILQELGIRGQAQL